MRKPKSVRKAWHMGGELLTNKNDVTAIRGKGSVISYVSLPIVKSQFFDTFLKIQTLLQGIPDPEEGALELGFLHWVFGTSIKVFKIQE